MTFAARARTVAIVVAYGVSLVAVFRMPPEIPRPVPLPAWSGRYVVAFFLPTFAVCLWFLLRALAARDPLPSRYGAGRAAREAVLTAAIVFVVGLHLILLATTLWPRPSLGRLLPLLLGAVMVTVGNVLPRLRPNLALGVRTPWALRDERVWARTHRTGGYLVVAWGLAMLIGAVTAPVAALYVMVLGVPVVPALLAALSFAFSRGARDTAPPVSPTRF